MAPSVETELPSIKSITKYRTHKEYAVDFLGNEVIVTETKTPSVIRGWIYSVRYNHRRSRSHPLVAGIGVQWTPTFKKSAPSPPADTLQLCVGRRCIIIKLRHCNRVPRVLRRFLVDSRNTFVGVRNHQDAKKLALSRHRLEIGELLDIKNYASGSKGQRLNGCSFGKIVEECYGVEGVRLNPKIGRSDWSVKFLKLGQILQATVDAYVCCDLGVACRLWEV